MGDSVREIMQGFALRTGLGQTDRPSTRYLWTDAFAVCNFLGLFVEEGDTEAMQRALQLVDDDWRVRLIGFGEFSIDVEVFVHVGTTDWGEFLEIAEVMNLGTINVLKRTGAKLATPHR